jgi:hypothetical protein
LDDNLTLLRNLTWRSRLHGVWHQFILCVTGARYAAKLFRLAHQNNRVLRHFCRCREVDQLQPERPSRFRRLNFYRETFRQCLRLFSPVRSAVPAIERETRSRPRRSKKQTTGTFPPVTLAVRRHHPQQRVSQPVTAPALSEVFTSSHPPSDAALAKSARKQPQRKRWEVRFKLQARALRLRYLPSSYAMKCKALLRIENRKAQRRQFYQRAQLTLLQEQQRIATLTQTALFLSLATAIDLQASRELTAAGQLVGKHRRHKTMTAEDIACFDQSLNALDGNHETVRVAVR